MKVFQFKDNSKVKVKNTFLDHFVFSCFTFEGLTNIFFNDRRTVINAFIADHTSCEKQRNMIGNVEFQKSIELW